MDQNPRIAAARSFYEAGFGLFLHYGLYSLLGRGEWVQHHEKIPAGQYQHLMQLFSARDFDADKIADLAVAAGQKYVCLTTKHHDGFCLFDSDFTGFTSMRSPAKRDLVGEMTEACRSRGLKIFYYYSLPDWHESDFYDAFDRYRRYLQDQVRELLTNYGPVDGLWFDNLIFYYAFPKGSPKGYPIEQWEMEPLYEMIHELQPHCLIGQNRAGIKVELPPGDDFDITERRALDYLTPTPEPPAEICHNINDHWGYFAGDTNHKSPETLAEMIGQARRKGFNYLLNTGPLPWGGIAPEHAEILKQTGQLLRERELIKDD